MDYFDVSFQKEALMASRYISRRLLESNWDDVMAMHLINTQKKE